MDNLYWVTTVAISTSDITLQLPDLFSNSFTVENTPSSSPGSGQTKPYGICFGASCWLNRLETLLPGIHDQMSKPSQLSTSSMSALLSWSLSHTPEETHFNPFKSLEKGVSSVGILFHCFLCLIRQKCFLLHSGKSIPTIVTMNDDGWNQSINQSINHSITKSYWIKEVVSIKQNHGLLHLQSENNSSIII